MGSSFDRLQMVTSAAGTRQNSFGVATTSSVILEYNRRAECVDAMPVLVLACARSSKCSIPSGTYRRSAPMVSSEMGMDNTHPRCHQPSCGQRTDSIHYPATTGKLLEQHGP